ncbi:MAG TPA: PHB depolymerase family esterase [Gemmatimonadaceae bacterium]|nr:PHB depolymerase family esterase [Gemmatimonadaceae bacterium]
MIGVALAMAVARGPAGDVPRMPAADGTVVRTVEVDGRRRSFRLHVPPASAVEGPLPLVFVFHGGGSTALGMERESGFSALADREGFLVVYPEGIGRSWSDGRGDRTTPAARQGIDDLRFVNRVIDVLMAEHEVDRGRVYATGISNGAMLSHMLATRLSDRIVAVAPVAGGLAEPLAQAFRPSRPVSVLVLQGTEDPLVPYSGGAVGRRGRGSIVSTDAMLGLWRRFNATEEIGREGTLADRAPQDGCRVQVRVWTGGREGSEVALYRLEGAGHTWPGGTQYLPQRSIGRVCRDIDGAAVIWEFFRRHVRR